ncbi:inorganic phosphate transporter [Sideroxydans lithotrophicus]|uniref:Phosphate transporter n=1 Tax=Sideroxydans lithotrophicus (strain ES-1) TaxID=580332 RepID=D5CLP3_SIDLE|nr:inorganic phosphate transporter [Sideroxydans lithotrophicus]ADE12488.1 phosphate transporter [Sideroxydans lithotrophicus ES-1]
MDSTILVLAISTIAIVLIFEYTNGFHDAANIIATLIASRAMTPVQSVLLVAFFEFLGPLLGGTAVADTIGTFVSLGDIDRVLALTIVLCGLIGAIAWNLLTWWFGIPSSSSHALVGGLAGVVMVAAGSHHVAWGFSDLLHGHLSGVAKVIAALILSPIIGFGIGYLLHKIMLRLLRGAHPSINRDLRHLQYVTSAGLAFSHGANDGQKSMGILTLVLLLGGFIPTFAVPFWVIVACSLTITLGILSGGWQIVRTLGFSIYKIRPLHALDSQMTAASVIFSSSLFGAPVSTTHVVASSIMGIGASERPKAVRWGKATEIATTWVITIPGAALMSISCYLVIRAFV